MAVIDLRQRASERPTAPLLAASQQIFQNRQAENRQENKQNFIREENTANRAGQLAQSEQEGRATQQNEVIKSIYGKGGLWEQWREGQGQLSTAGLDEANRARLQAQQAALKEQMDDARNAWKFIGGTDEQIQHMDGQVAAKFKTEDNTLVKAEQLVQLVDKQVSNPKEREFALKSLDAFIRQASPSANINVSDLDDKLNKKTVRGRNYRGRAENVQREKDQTRKNLMNKAVADKTPLDTGAAFEGLGGLSGDYMADGAKSNTFEGGVQTIQNMRKSGASAQEIKANIDISGMSTEQADQLLAMLATIDGE